MARRPQKVSFLKVIISSFAFPKCCEEYIQLLQSNMLVTIVILSDPYTTDCAVGQHDGMHRTSFCRLCQARVLAYGGCPA